MSLSQASQEFWKKLFEQPEQAAQIADAFIRNTCPECMNTGMVNGLFCEYCPEGRLLTQQARR